MGSSGQYLESGGFNPPLKWETAGYIECIKVLEKKDKTNKSLPLYSNTPGTVYITMHNEKFLKQIRVYGMDRKPLYDIDYHTVDTKLLLHIHYFPNRKREKEQKHRELTEAYPVHRL